MNKKRWTTEEESRLLALIEENPWNLKEAFRAFQQEYPERTLNAITFKWYGDMAKRNNVNTCMILLGKRHKLTNKKNIYKGVLSSPKRSTKSIWNKVLKMLGL